MAAVTNHRILESKKIVCHCFILLSHLFAMKGWDQMSWSFVFWILSFKPVFSLFPTRGSKFFTFYHKGGVICIPEVIDISPLPISSEKSTPFTLCAHWKKHPVGASLASGRLASPFSLISSGHCPCSPHKLLISHILGSHCNQQWLPKPFPQTRLLLFLSKHRVSPEGNHFSPLLSCLCH